MLGILKGKEEGGLHKGTGAFRFWGGGPSTRMKLSFCIKIYIIYIFLRSMSCRSIFRVFVVKKIKLGAEVNQ